MGTKDKRVDAYIANSAEFAKPILTYIRAVVHEACPDVEEAIKWSTPSFMYRDSPLGNGVGEAVPRFDELVELEVERTEQRADDVPVQLLADEGQVDQLDERRLQLVADLVALVVTERR